MSFWQTIETLLAAESSEQIFSIVLARAEKIGFDNVGFALCANPRVSAAQGDAVITQNSYKNAWASSYQRLHDRYAAALDARVQVSQLSLPAAAWNALGEMSLPIMRQRIPQADQQISTACAFGIRGGVTLPVQCREIDWGFFTFSSANTHALADMEHYLGELHVLSSISAARIVALASLTKQANLNEHPKDLNLQRAAGEHFLSTREAEVLRWCAIGKTSWEIAEILHISERTVNFHLSKIASRFGVRGRLAACAMAISHRLIAL